LSRGAAADGWQMHEAACVSYGMLTPYLPFRNLLTRYFDVEDGDDARRIREKVATRMVALDTRLAGGVSAILALGNVLNDDAEWDALAPTMRRQRILKAVRELLLAESRRAPLLLVVESLEWADSETHALVEDLAAGLAEARMLVVVTARPERRRDWSSTGDTTEIRLDPLGPASAAALADAILGPADELAALKRRLGAHTAGNAFFMEEIVQALAELEAADFVRPSALVPDLAYSFKHAITQEVAYATLLKEQRRALHARIVAALEASYPGERRAEHVERLAYHALRAEAWPTAVGYLRDAGERAVARSANREAAAFYEDALRALAHLPESRDTFALAIDLRLDLRVPLLQLGRLDDLHRLSKEAESMA